MAPGLVDDAATQHGARRARRRPGDRSTCGSASTSRCSGSAARPGARRVGRRARSSAQLESRRGRRRGPRRAVRPRRPVRLPGPARAGDRLRCPTARARAGRDRRRRRRGQGPADPRRPAGRRRPDARDRRRDRRGRRRARRVATPAAAPRRRDERPRTARSSASTSARTRSRRASSTLDGRLLGARPRRLRARPLGRSRLGRAGPGRLVVGGRQRGPRAARRRTLGEVVAIGVDGHGPTLVAVDDRGEATRPAITFLDTRATAEAAELAAATGVRGWALGGLPAALWVERHEPAVAAATRWYLTTWEWLAFRLTGEAVAPLVPDQLVAGSGARRRGGRAGATRLPPTGETGAVVGALTDDRGRRARPACRASRSSAARSTRSRATSAPASSSRATPTTRAARPAGSGSTGIEPVEVPGAFVTPAPLAGPFSVGAAMAATGRALDWYRDGILGGDDHHRGAARRGRGDAARRGRPRLPAVPRRRAVADLGPERARRARRPDARPRPRPPRPGDRRGLRAGDPPRRGADAGGRRPGDRDARLRRPGPERRLERRSRPTSPASRSPSRRSSRPPSLGSRDPGRRRASAPIPTCRAADPGR